MAGRSWGVEKSAEKSHTDAKRKQRYEVSVESDVEIL
jgi:hypothetical protein